MPESVGAAQVGAVGSRSTARCTVREIEDLPRALVSVATSFLSARDVAALGRVRRGTAEAVWNNAAVWMAMGATAACCGEARDAFRRTCFRLDGSRLRALRPMNHAEIFVEAARMTRGLLARDRAAARLIAGIAGPALHRRDPMCASTACAAEGFLSAARIAEEVFGSAEVDRMHRAFDGVTVEALEAQRHWVLEDMHKELREDFESAFMSEDEGDLGSALPARGPKIPGARLPRALAHGRAPC